MPSIMLDHLYLGDYFDNASDRDNRGRNFSSAKTHCKYGHEFNEENTYTKGGHRWCRTCDREKKCSPMYVFYRNLRES